MLSILIPIYNYNCVKLVQKLHSQAVKESITFEILCFDDGSALYKEENRKINSIPHCKYVELETNIGRSKIRNLLAENASYDYLLFLDCDVEILSMEYIKTYLENLQDFNIISGKRIYTAMPPADTKYYFHWYYGTYREVKSDNFMSNNFIIKKSLWQRIRFNENIASYGHEDTLFQIQLEQEGILVHFIDNPVIHIGLDSNDFFIEKSNESIENLLNISKKETLSDKVRLLKTYHTIRRWKFNHIFSFLFPLIRKFFIKNFTGKRPNLLAFDIYKLMYISHVDKSDNDAKNSWWKSSK